MKKLLFLSFCLDTPLFSSSAQIIQGESTTTQTLFLKRKFPKSHPRYQGDTRNDQLPFFNDNSRHTY